MKRNFLIALFALFTMTGWAQVSPTSTLVGLWSGKLEADSLAVKIESLSAAYLAWHRTTGATNEYRQIEETILPEMLSDIA